MLDQDIVSLENVTQKHPEDVTYQVPVFYQQVG